jgi:RepB DNA-primase from phage plasmid
MLHLRNFLQRVIWTGEVPGCGDFDAVPADVAMTRLPRLLLESIADRLPSRGWELGIRNLDKSSLSLGKYQADTVRRGLKTLERAGLVTNERTRNKKTGLEGYSTVYLSPALIELACRWQAVKKHMKAASPRQKKELQLEMKNMQAVKLPFLYQLTGNQVPTPVFREQLVKNTASSREKIPTIYTGTHAPQAAAEGDWCACGPLADSKEDKPGEVPPHGPQGPGGRVPLSWDALPDEPCEDVLQFGLAAFQIFKRDNLARVAAAEARMDVHSSSDELATKWQPDARPRHQEWDKDSNWLVNSDHSTFFEVRAFSATLDMFNQSTERHSGLSLVNPLKNGKRKLYRWMTDKRCGWLDMNTNFESTRQTNWEKAFHKAWAGSQNAFAETGSGEQIFCEPLENSRMVLIDDLHSYFPVLRNTKCIILQTSQYNYQHLYCADRVLTFDERAYIQRVLAARFGGDQAATSGKQPHRVPGSINYKAGRSLFVTRLVGTLSDIDNYKTFKAADFLPNQPLKETQRDCSTTPQRASVAPAASSQKTNDASRQDWRNCIKLIASLRALGTCDSDVKNQVEYLLQESAQLRGKHKGYPAITMRSLVAAGHL